MSFPTYPTDGDLSHYPAPVYNGEPGEASAWLRRAEAEPEIRYTSGGACHYLAQGTATRGEFGLYRWDMSPDSGGPDPHFHRSISESFFVLSGVISLYDGNAWIDARPGDFLFVPEGGVHGFRNDSGADASMLILFAPGAPREDYFETLADLGATGRTMSEEEKQEFFLRHDTFWV